MRRQDLTGLKFGSLEVLAFSGTKIYGGQKKTIWKCRCDCGSLSDIAAAALKSGGSKTCGCSHRRHHDKSPNWSGAGGLSGSVYCQIRNGASCRGLSFEVTREYLWDLLVKQDSRCALSGLEISLSSKRRRAMSLSNTASLDRIDPRRGYEIGNVQWVHKDINLMKNKFTEAYFISLCRLVSTRQRP